MLGILAAGVGLCVTGLLVASAAGRPLNTCQSNAWLQALLNQRSESCTALDVRFDAGLGTAALGVVVTAAALVLLYLGGRRAARAGSPWPLRRAAQAAACWLDARLPGTTGTQPRLRPGYICALGLVLVIAAGTGVASAWRSHDQAQHARAVNQQLAAFARAQATLSAIRLPPSFQPTSCGAGQICARTMLTPAQVLPILERLVRGKVLPAAENPASECRPGRVCYENVDVEGSIAGYPATAFAFRWPIHVRHGHPPTGATPIDGADPGAFWDGSEVGIGLALPNN